MTELKLYKFIHDNDLEIDWRGDRLVLWVDFHCLDKFAQMIYLIVEGYETEAYLQQYCIAIDIVPICECLGIDPTDIKAKKQNNEL